MPNNISQSAQQGSPKYQAELSEGASDGLVVECWALECKWNFAETHVDITSVVMVMNDLVTDDNYYSVPEAELTQTVD